MKNLLLLLVLANILYFLWGMFVEESAPPGTAIINESDLGPPLNVITSRGSQVSGQLVRAGSSRRSGINAVTGPSCASIGPFKVSTDAHSAVLALTNKGLKSVVRAKTGQVFVGHWVQIRNVADDRTANRMLKKLDKGGLSDSYLVRTEDEGLKISLGLFGELDRAEKVELQARSLDLPADIKPRTADRQVYFVDVALPPGAGASAIVKEYGEDQVLLRNKATCPK